jgi:hypothetical protein
VQTFAYYVSPIYGTQVSYFCTFTHFRRATGTREISQADANARFPQSFAPILTHVVYAQAPHLLAWITGDTSAPSVFGRIQTAALYSHCVI